MGDCPYPHRWSAAGEPGKGAIPSAGEIGFEVSLLDPARHLEA
jgi:hypothetical protein